ncbi:MAG: hypothetical protein ACREDJ_04640, partial [Methylocella sp.]
MRWSRSPLVIMLAEMGAISAVERLQTVRPEMSIDLVAGGPAPGVNRKISNLSKMVPLARRGALVVADGDT